MKLNNMSKLIIIGFTLPLIPSLSQAGVIESTCEYITTLSYSQAIGFGPNSNPSTTIPPKGPISEELIDSGERKAIKPLYEKTTIAIHSYKQAYSNNNTKIDEPLILEAAMRFCMHSAKYSIQQGIYTEGDL